MTIISLLAPLKAGSPFEAAAQFHDEPCAHELIVGIIVATSTLQTLIHVCISFLFTLRNVLLHHALLWCCWVDFADQGCGEFEMLVIAKDEINILPNECWQTTNQPQSYINTKNWPRSFFIASVLYELLNIDSINLSAFIVGYSLCSHLIIRATIFTIV